MAEQTKVLVLHGTGRGVVTVSSKYLRLLEATESVDCLGTTLKGQRCEHVIGGTTRGKLPSYNGAGLVVTVQDSESGLIYLTYHCWQHVKQVPSKFLEAFNQPGLDKRLPHINMSIAIAGTKSSLPAQISVVERLPLAFKSTNTTVKSRKAVVVKLPPCPAADSKFAQQANPPNPRIKSEDADTKPDLSAQNPSTLESVMPQKLSPFNPSSSPFVTFGNKASAASTLCAPPSFTFTSTKSLNLDDALSLPLSSGPKKLNVFNDQNHQIKLEVSAKAPVKVEKSATITKDLKLPTSIADMSKVPDISKHISSHASVTVNKVEIETATATPSSVPSETAKAPPVEPPTPTWEQTANDLKKELAEMRRTVDGLELIIVKQALEIKNNARPDSSKSRDSATQSENSTDKAQEKDSQAEDAPLTDAADTAPADTENEKTGLISEPSDVRARPSMSMSRGLQTEPSSSSSERGSGFWKSLDFVLCGCNFGRRYEEI